MEIKDKIESLKYLSQIQRQQFDERRKYEWKIVFTTLTFYVLCVSAVYTTSICFKSYVDIIIWIFFLFVVLAVSSFLKELHQANDFNKKYAENSEDALNNLLVDETSKISSLVPSKSEKHCILLVIFKIKLVSPWAWRWQFIILLSFAIAASYLITNYAPQLPNG